MGHYEIFDSPFHTNDVSHVLLDTLLLALKHYGLAHTNVTYEPGRQLDF